jgi:hypothetical protein
MLFLISNEIIPESYRREVKTHATISFMVGLVAMMFLDVARSGVSSTVWQYRHSSAGDGLLFEDDYPAFAG